MCWIQTKNHGDRRHRRDTAALPPQFSTSDCTNNQEVQDNQEEQDVAKENENLSLLSDSKKSKSSSHCDEASEIVTQGNQELGFASGAQQCG
jgi:hypothetical protein